ncbi:(3,5-dihydroxyphenyl)acetyl-CoA 1,2-dioxygenase DpgC [Nocardia sp. NPDC060249]|uniref:(3,5-dihydroxyphenyl)acetyl-CoA 1,2-dioxygenase DpgC n=1 Tax=Nocardia sp. NPDC060249 TaxID=3347082 RepID=UPI003660B7F5
MTAAPVMAAVPTGHLADDHRDLATAAAAHNALLAELGPASARSEADRAAADASHRSIRLARQRFLAVHARSCYLACTDDLRVGLRFGPLAEAATELFPGLLPTAAQLAHDDGLTQSEKEGWEIDLGLFFHAVLSDPVAGEHLLDAMRAPTDRALALLPEFEATGHITLPAVTLERTGDVAQLTITNNYCLNAEDNQHVADMETAVDLALLDPAVRVGVVRGGVMDHPRYRGRRVFSAGINLAHLHEGKISYTDFLLGREAGYIAKLLRGLPGDETTWPARALTKPWIAVVDSFAIGGGAQLLLVFDRVIAASDSYFSLPAAQEGIIPGAGNLRLGRGSTHRLSREVILWGRKIQATDPDAGYVFDTVVEPEQLEEELERAAIRLASPAVVVNKHILTTAEEPQDVFRRYLAEFAYHQALRMNGADVLSKVRRFHSKSGAS